MTTIDIPGYSSSSLTTLGFIPNIINRELNYTKIYNISKRIFVGVIYANGDYVLNKVGGITRPLDLKIYTKAWDIFYHEVSKARAKQKGDITETPQNLIDNPGQLPVNGVLFDLTQEHPEEDPKLNQVCPECHTQGDYQVESINLDVENNKVLHLKCNKCGHTWDYKEK